MTPKSRFILLEIEFQILKRIYKVVIKKQTGKSKLLQLKQKINIFQRGLNRKLIQQKPQEMKKAIIRKQDKINGKGQKGRGSNVGKNKSNLKNSEQKQYNDKNDYEIQSLSGDNSAELDQEQNHLENNKIQKFEIPEEVKQRIGKNMLQKLNSRKNKKDDFFIVEEDEEDKILVQKNNNAFYNKEKEQTIDEEVIQQLKEEHLRKQNKLYESFSEQFTDMLIEEPIEYKGHLQTITAIQATPTSIFSCSKDRSIIRWDRETGKKDFISLGKDLDHHRADVLCMALHTSNDNIIATAGQDTLIKLWDVRAKNCIGTLKGHRSTVNGIKFGINSNILCSVSKDLTLKEWDVSQKGLMETFYQHNNEVLDIDHFNATDFVTSGNDHQTIVWKTQKQTKIAYKGHDYAIDRVRSINQQRFVTACMDGSINLWHAKRSKAVFKNTEAHVGWICALDTLKKSNIMASGGTDNVIKIWGIENEMKGMTKLRQIAMKGITTDIKLFKNELIATECEEHRLGRWITAKTRNKIKVFKFKNAL